MTTLWPDERSNLSTKPSSTPVNTLALRSFISEADAACATANGPADATSWASILRRKCLNVGRERPCGACGPTLDHREAPEISAVAGSTNSVTIGPRQIHNPPYLLTKSHERSDMNLRQLRAAHAVAELGSVTAAANRLGLTQSAVSRMIGGLEAELGVVLF